MAGVTFLGLSLCVPMSAGAADAQKISLASFKAGSG